MKTVRILFLLLLAMLLPLRGAMAAAMLCPPGDAGTTTEMGSATTAGHHMADMDMAMDHGASHQHASTHHADGHSGDHAGGLASKHDQGTPDKCHMCSAFCSLAPLASEAPRLPEPAVLPAMKFPDFSTPAPSFLSDGQDRPPRTI